MMTPTSRAGIPVEKTQQSSIREFSNLAGNRARPIEELLHFTASNIHTIRFDDIATSSTNDFHVRTYSADDFLLVHSVGLGEAGACTQVRDIAEIARDGQDRFVMLTQTRGETTVSQFGRSQHLKA